MSSVRADIRTTISKGLHLLGPQRAQPTVGPVLHSLGIDGPVAAITAGWQEREGEVDELAGHITLEVRDLQLYHRAELVHDKDSELADAYRERQRALQEMQRLHRLRLKHAISAARELLRNRATGAIVDRERKAAITALRTLDRNHLKRMRAMHESFRREHKPQQRPTVITQREKIAAIIEACDAILIAGGHVAVLLNRLRMFDLAPLLATRPVLAWSAGAMALSERVVLFHDSPPQGPGDPEVLEHGLGLCSGIVPLPHGSERLRLDDRQRVSLFARRFSPQTCVLLDSGAMLDIRTDGVHEARNIQCLSNRGSIGRIAQGTTIDE